MTKSEREKVETATKVLELKNKGMTQVQIARQLGINQSTVSRIKNGKNCYAK